MTTAGRAGRIGLAPLVAVALAIAGCSGGDSRSSPSTVESTVALGTLATGTVPVTAASPDPTAVVPPILADDGSDASTFSPAALLAGDGTRPWLLAGTSRDRPGQPARLAVLTSSDGATWTTMEVDAPADSMGAAAAVGPDGTAVIAGTIDGDDGPHPALWTLDGDAFDDREDVAVDGVVRAMALDDAGSPVLLLDGTDGPVVAVSTGSSWRATTLPDAVDPAGIAVRADALVVTGPTTWRSTDAGATFEPVATSPLGPVVASGGGFAAADCTTGGVAISGDGSTWTPLLPVDPRGEVPVAGECGTIDVDDEGGVWLAATVGGEPVVYRILDGAVDRLGVPVRPPGTIFAGPRLVAAKGGTVVAALGQPGGVALSNASAVSLTTGLELDAAMTATTGAPRGHQVPVAVVPFDDRGTVAGVLTSPYVVDDPDASYRWTTRAAAARIAAAGRLEPDEHAAPTGADGNLGGIVTTPDGEVALATVPDPSPAPDAGSLGDVVVSRRTDNGWSARASVLEGAGRQAVNAVVAVGATVVGVGEQSRVDATTGAEQLVPLVLVGAGSAFEPVTVEGAGAASLTAACRAPDGSVLAFGRDPSTGTNIAVAIDLDAGRAAMRPGPPGSAPVGCASTHDAIFVASAGAVTSTVDGEQYEPLEVLRPGETVTAVAVGPGAVAVTGTTSLDDGFVLLLGPTGRATRLDAAVLGGPGDHLPTGVVVGAADIIVLGLGDGAPTAWRVGR